MKFADKIKIFFAGIILIGVIIILCLPDPRLSKMPDREQITFWHMWTGDYAKQADAICDNFNKYQDKYEVVPLSLPTSAEQKLLMSVAGGNPPDIMVQWNPVIPQWADNGLLTPMDDFMTKEERKFFDDNAFPITKKISIYKGKIYGMPTSMGLLGVFYHPDILAEYGYKHGETPKTLEELTELSYKMSVVDKKGNVKKMGFMPYHLQTFLAAWGNGLYDYDKQELTINTPGNLKAVEYMVDLRKHYGYNKVLKFEAGLQGTEGDASLLPFSSKIYSMLHDGSWKVSVIQKQLPDFTGYKIMATPPPVGGNSNYSWLGNCYLLIPKGSKHSKGAYEFIKYWSGITDPDEGAKIMNIGGWLPAFRAVRDSKTYQNWLKKNPLQYTFVNMLESDNIIYFPPVPYQLFVSDKLTYYYDLAMRGKITPKQALDRMESDINREIKRRERFKLEN